MREELGIAVCADRLLGPLAPAHRRELHVPGRFRDCEFVETYRPARALFSSWGSAQLRTGAVICTFVAIRNPTNAPVTACAAAPMYCTLRSSN